MRLQWPHLPSPTPLSFGSGDGLPVLWVGRACGSHQGAWNLTKAFFSPLTSASKLAGVSSRAEATENRATSAAKTAFIVEDVLELFVDLRREHTEPTDFVSGGCGLGGAGRVTGRQGRGPRAQGNGEVGRGVVRWLRMGAVRRTGLGLLSG